MTQPWIGQVCHPIYARISTCLWQHSVWTTRCVCKGLGLQAVTNDFIHLLHFFLLIPHSFLFWFQDLFTYLFWWWIYFPLTTTHSMIPSIVESLPSVATIVFLVPSCYTISFACKRQDKRLLFSTCKCVFPHWFRRQPNIHLLPRLFYSPPPQLFKTPSPLSIFFFFSLHLPSIYHSSPSSSLHILLCYRFSYIRTSIQASIPYHIQFPLPYLVSPYPSPWSLTKRSIPSRVVFAIFVCVLLTNWQSMMSQPTMSRDLGSTILARKLNSPWTPTRFPSSQAVLSTNMM